MRAAYVADVRDGRAAILWLARHSPTRHHKLALAICAGADDRGHLIGEHRRQRRQIARAIVLHAEKVADSRLPFGDAVEVAHGAQLCSDKAGAQRGSEMLSWLRRRRESAGRIEAKAGDLVRGFGADAYSEARLREQHAGGLAERKQWSAIALAIARMTGKRVGLDTATRMTMDADYSTDSEASGGSPRAATPEIDPIAELKRIISRG
jgi:hypothetical protein